MEQEEYRAIPIGRTVLGLFQVLLLRFFGFCCCHALTVAGPDPLVRMVVELVAHSPPVP